MQHEWDRCARDWRRLMCCDNFFTLRLMNFGLNNYWQARTPESWSSASRFMAQSHPCAAWARPRLSKGAAESALTFQLRASPRRPPCGGRCCIARTASSWGTQGAQLRLRMSQTHLLRNERCSYWTSTCLLRWLGTTTLSTIRRMNGFRAKRNRDSRLATSLKVDSSESASK